MPSKFQARMHKNILWGAVRGFSLFMALWIILLVCSSTIGNYLWLYALIAGMSAGLIWQYALTGGRVIGVDEDCLWYGYHGKDKFFSFDDTFFNYTITYTVHIAGIHLPNQFIVAIRNEKRKLIYCNYLSTQDFKELCSLLDKKFMVNYYRKKELES